MNPKWIALGVKLYPLISMAVTMVEKVAKAAKGKDKQDAAVEAIGVGLELVEAGTDKDLLDNAEVNAAVRSAIDAYVHLQNVIASVKAAKVAVPNG